MLCKHYFIVLHYFMKGIHFVASVEAISLGGQAGIHPWIIFDIIWNAAGNSWDPGKFLIPFTVGDFVLSYMLLGKQGHPFCWSTFHWRAEMQGNHFLCRKFCFCVDWDFTKGSCFAQ
ncbi:hypothetical protein LguiA_015978 [Lonicera macranthoides]